MRLHRIQQIAAARKARLLRFLAGCCLVLAAATAFGQTISPPLSEYRGKAQGMVELRNDSDLPLAAIVEVTGFSVDEHGTLKYEPLDPAVKVQLGANSFIIPPRQSHYVFYKAASTKPSAWFAILSTLTKANQEANQMRINFVLPHVVYIYQKQKLKKEDIEVRVSPGAAQGEYKLQIQNRSDKLGRVEMIQCRRFEKELDLGGLPVFPAATRWVDFKAGTATESARVKVLFEDGFSVEVPLQ